MAVIRLTLGACFSMAAVIFFAAVASSSAILRNSSSHHRDFFSASGSPATGSSAAAHWQRRHRICLAFQPLLQRLPLRVRLVGLSAAAGLPPLFRGRARFSSDGPTTNDPGGRLRTTSTEPSSGSGSNTLRRRSTAFGNTAKVIAAAQTQGFPCYPVRSSIALSIHQNFRRMFFVSHGLQCPCTQKQRLHTIGNQTDLIRPVFLLVLTFLAGDHHPEQRQKPARHGQSNLYHHH